jgi:hypothetical protein
MVRFRDWEDGDSSLEADDDEESPDDDDEEPTISCPYCHREVHEDSQRCPHCANYISKEDAPPERKPWWIIVGVIACLYVVYRWNVWW